MPGRVRANGEGSIFPYRNGFAAYVWVTKPDGKRDRKYVYGRTREIVHDKWIKLHQQAKAGPVATSVPTVASYLAYWLREVVEPNLALATYVSYEGFTRFYIVPGLGAKRLDRLQVRDVQTWLNSVAKTCQCCARERDAARPRAKQRCCAIGKMLQCDPIRQRDQGNPGDPTRGVEPSSRRGTGDQKCRRARQGACRPQETRKGVGQRRSAPIPGIRPRGRRPSLRRVGAASGARPATR